MGTRRAVGAGSINRCVLTLFHTGYIIVRRPWLHRLVRLSFGYGIPIGTSNIQAGFVSKAAAVGIFQLKVFDTKPSTVGKLNTVLLFLAQIILFQSLTTRRRIVVDRSMRLWPPNG